MFGTPTLLYSAGPAPLTLLSNILGYWKFEGNAYDEVGHTTGVDTNITYAAGKIGLCSVAQPAGSNTTTTVLGVGGNNPFSISSWVLMPSTVGFGVYGVTMWRTGTDWVNLRALPSTPTGPPSPLFKFSLQYSAMNQVDTVGTYSADVWHHVVATFEGGIRGVTKLYVDGVLDKTFTPSANLYITTPQVIKHHVWLMGDSTAGSADELGIWSRTLTQGDVTALFNAGAGKQYPF